MSVALLFPVLDRPHRIEPLLANIRNATPQPHAVVFIASDEPTVRELHRTGATYILDGGGTWPNRINKAFTSLDHAYVFLGADDVVFHPGWLPPLLQAQADMGERGGVAVPNDLHNPNGTLALVSRRYVLEVGAVIDTPGAVVYPGYRHNWCDTELFQTAIKLGHHRYVEDSIVEHLHPCAEKAPRDATYDKGLASYGEDQAIHESRTHLWA